MDITINYVLSNTEGLHFEQGVELSKLGVDIYNREDKCYNDKCFPFNSDKGDMILKEEVTIGEDETTGELWERLSKIGGNLLVETLRIMFS